MQREELLFLHTQTDDCKHYSYISDMEHMKHYLTDQQAPLIGNFPILRPMKANTVSFISMGILITRRNTGLNGPSKIYKNCSWTDIMANLYNKKYHVMGKFVIYTQIRCSTQAHNQA